MIPLERRFRLQMVPVSWVGRPRAATLQERQIRQAACLHFTVDQHFHAITDDALRPYKGETDVLLHPVGKCAIGQIADLGAIL